MMMMMMMMVDAYHQTDFQRKRFVEVREKACSLASKTLPRLLSRLDSSSFRDKLSAKYASWTAEELLQHVRDSFQSVEIVSGFSVNPPQSSEYFDMNVREGEISSFFESMLLCSSHIYTTHINSHPCPFLSYPLFAIEIYHSNVTGILHLRSKNTGTWDAMVRHNASFDGGKGWWSIQDDVETKLYGLKAFERRGDPHTMFESIERGIYTLLNTARVDAGSPLYGDATVVLNRTFVQDSLLLSAIDTGGTYFNLHNHTQQCTHYLNHFIFTRVDGTL